MSFNLEDWEEIPEDFSVSTIDEIQSSEEEIEETEEKEEKSKTIVQNTIEKNEILIEKEKKKQQLIKKILEIKTVKPEKKEEKEEKSKTIVKPNKILQLQQNNQIIEQLQLTNKPIGSTFNGKIKLILLGDVSVGKSSILTQQKYKIFKQNDIEPTLGIDISYQYINKYKGKTIQVEITDTSGQERFSALTKSYYRDVDGCILVYSLDDKKSLDNIKKWLNEFNLNSNNSDTIKVLVCNKIDLKDKYQLTDKGSKFACNNNMPFFIVSAKKQYNIKQLFEFICAIILKNNSLYNKIIAHGNNSHNSSNSSIQNISVNSKSKHFIKSCFCS